MQKNCLQMVIFEQQIIVHIMQFFIQCEFSRKERERLVICIRDEE